MATHSFNVERIARRIAERWCNVRDPIILDRISQAALHHDDEEAIIGDMPSPAKKYLREDYLDEQGRLWYDLVGQYGAIVKLADKMEAYQFLITERILGNRYVDFYIDELRAKMYQLSRDLGCNAYLQEWLFDVNNIRGTTHGPTKRSTTGGAQGE